MKILHTTTLALSLALCSCASNKKVEASEPQAVPIPQVESLEGDRSIEQHIETLILATTRHLGRKRVQLQINNISDLDLRFRYALEWKNKRDEIIGGYHHDWMPMELGALESKTLTITGPTKAAETWRFHAESLDLNSEEPQEAPTN